MSTEELRGRVLETAGLVDYQSGSVVSRTLVQNPSGTVTLFAFDRGQGLSEHTAPFDALVLVLAGAAEIRLAGVAHTVKAGQMLIMPTQVPHALEAKEPFKMALVMIRS